MASVEEGRNSINNTSEEMGDNLKSLYEQVKKLKNNRVQVVDKMEQLEKNKVELQHNFNKHNSGIRGLYNWIFNRDKLTSIKSQLVKLEEEVKKVENQKRNIDQKVTQANTQRQNLYADVHKKRFRALLAIKEQIPIRLGVLREERQSIKEKTLLEEEKAIDARGKVNSFDANLKEANEGIRLDNISIARLEGKVNDYKLKVNKGQELSEKEKKSFDRVLVKLDKANKSLQAYQEVKMVCEQNRPSHVNVMIHAERDVKKHKDELEEVRGKINHLKKLEQNLNVIENDRKVIMAEFESNFGELSEDRISAMLDELRDIDGDLKIVLNKSGMESTYVDIPHDPLLQEVDKLIYSEPAHTNPVNVKSERKPTPPSISRLKEITRNQKALVQQKNNLNSVKQKAFTNANLRNDNLSRSSSQVSIQR